MSYLATPDEIIVVGFEEEEIIDESRWHYLRDYLENIDEEWDGWVASGDRTQFTHKHRSLKPTSFGQHRTITIAEAIADFKMAMEAEDIEEAELFFRELRRTLPY